MSYHNMTILVYHKLSNHREGKSYTIQKKDFENHMEYLYQNNYKCIMVDDCVQVITEKNGCDYDKRILITFDDGYESDYNIVLPVLKKYNFKATFFITTDWVGVNGFMDRKQLQALKAEGMSVQSHAKTHMFLDDMRKDDVFEEIYSSKGKLENILGSTVSFLSFPGGRYNNKVIECSEKLGLSALFSSEPYHFMEFHDTKLIGRCMVKYVSNGDNFYHLINSSNYIRMKHIGSNYGKKMLRRVIGNKLYHRLWSIITSK